MKNQFTHTTLNEISYRLRKEIEEKEKIICVYQEERKTKGLPDLEPKDFLI